jgi:hypothetical protein
MSWDAEFVAKQQPEGAVMIKENWRLIVLTLLGANLVFMALLEVQRRMIITREREFIERIEQILMSSENKARATQVSEIEMRTARARQVSEIEMRTKDTYERVIMMQVKLNEIGSGPAPR